MKFHQVILEEFERFGRCCCYQAPKVIAECMVLCLSLLKQGRELDPDPLGAFRTHATVRLIRARH